MNRIRLSAAAMTAFAMSNYAIVPALAQTDAQPEADQSEARWQDSERMQVTPAELIIGLNLTDNEDQTFGTITHLMMDLVDAEIVFALASGGPEEFGTFLAVPWDVVKVDDYAYAGWRTTGLQLDATQEELDSALRYDIERVLELTTPSVSAEITDQYEATIEDPWSGDTLLLYSQETLGTLSPPPATTDTQLYQSLIYTSDDSPLGEIEQIMLTVEDGRIPYVLVSVGGFLGGAAGWVPIPPQALEWKADFGRYSIDMTREELDSLPLTGAPQLGAFVRASDLEALYEAYDIEAYWME